MDSATLLRLLAWQSQMDEKNYLLTTIAYIAAPTLFHNKPSSLTSFTTSKRRLYGIWESYKEEIAALLGIEYIELRRTEDRILVLFYRPESLRKVLGQPQHAEFLQRNGYPQGMTVNEALLRLQNRMARTFPHEIGIFLGYPLEDVIGFIENNGQEYLLCKYWKVYHNPERARKLFASYDRARTQVVHLLDAANVPYTNQASTFRISRET